VDDDLAARDLRRVRERRLELLLAQPAAGDAGRLVGLRRGVEEQTDVMAPLPDVAKLAEPNQDAPS